MLPLYLRKGMASFFSRTFSRYLTARVSCMPLMARAVSKVFLKETLQKKPVLAYLDSFFFFVSLFDFRHSILFLFLDVYLPEV